MTQPSGKITTFYSYKGGTGRSMLLANCGWLLAESGRHVLMVDWDLEAPGLHRYFMPFLDDPEQVSTEGLIDFVLEYASAAVSVEHDDNDQEWFLEYAEAIRYATQLLWTFSSGGTLSLLSAGRQGSSYATRVNTFNWHNFYERLGGFRYFEAVKKSLRETFDDILIDSRTGVSDTSGISTVQFPDKIAICFTLNNQSIRGASAVAASIYEQRCEAKEFDIFPIPTRVDNSESEKLLDRWRLAKLEFASFPKSLQAESRDAYWANVHVPYVPLFSYEEVLARFANRLADPPSVNLLSCYSRIARHVFECKEPNEDIDVERQREVLEVFAGRRARKATIDSSGVKGRDRYSKIHVLVSMPFGKKKDPDGKEIDFNRVYNEYIKPVLEEADLEVFRADEETRAGDIRGDMFQELLIADLVVADLTLDNPNVWYELGVRHALRARGVVLVQSDRAYQPLDTFTDRKLRYSLKDGAPDPASLENDRAALRKIVEDTLKSWHGRKNSPVFDQLENLQEQDWRSLVLNDHTRFSDTQKRWQQAMETARRKLRAADILVLAEEAPTQALWLEGIRTAITCLMQLQQYQFALEQIEKGLDLDPDNVDLRQRMAICLGRMDRFEDARTQVLDLSVKFHKDAEVLALQGRIAKTDWIQSWRSSDQMGESAWANEVRLAEAVGFYLEAFLQDPKHYYSGINAVTLRHVQKHLGGIPDESIIRTNDLEGGIKWACLSALRHNPKDFWARTTLAELCLLLHPVEQVVREYRAAVAVADNDWFALDSTRQTLEILRDLEFRPEVVNAALDVIERETKRLRQPWQPRQVIIFSGHLVDAPNRPKPRFPFEKVSIAEAEIAKALDDLHAGPEDLALTQGAAGGDLLFAEACQARGVKLKLMQPFTEPKFIERSVVPPAGEWRSRYYAVRAKLERPVMDMNAELGPSSRNAFERCNLWML